jgi:hypothetical protein
MAGLEKSGRSAVVAARPWSTLVNLTPLFIIQQQPLTVIFFTEGLKEALESLSPAKHKKSRIPSSLHILDRNQLWLCFLAKEKVLTVLWASMDIDS